ncbi:hypothetical protein B0H10DRAFT_988895 [Mycena sp. CBHHK59/15]|nr:hypothetical protein B0H10DRAFT_988895 [Mycena sp. CBHHK59/15]
MRMFEHWSAFLFFRPTLARPTAPVRPSGVGGWTVNVGLCIHTVRGDVVATKHRAALVVKRDRSRSHMNLAACETSSGSLFRPPQTRITRKTNLNPSPWVAFEHGSFTRLHAPVPRWRDPRYDPGC